MQKVLICNIFKILKIRYNIQNMKEQVSLILRLLIYLIYILLYIYHIYTIIIIKYWIITQKVKQLFIIYIQHMQNNLTNSSQIYIEQIKYNNIFIIYKYQLYFPFNHQLFIKINFNNNLWYFLINNLIILINKILLFFMIILRNMLRILRIW